MKLLLPMLLLCSTLTLAQSTLSRGDVEVVTTVDSTFEVYQSGILIALCYDSAQLRRELFTQYLNATGAEGAAISDARDQARLAAQYRFIISQVDTINVVQEARSVYGSQLEGTYILRESGGDPVRVKFDDRLVYRDGDTRYVIRVYSISNLDLVGYEENPIRLTQGVSPGPIKIWEGETSKGNRLILRKIR